MPKNDFTFIKIQFILICFFSNRYEGNSNDASALSKMVDGADGGPKSLEYTVLVAWVTAELKVLLELEEHVNPITASEDHASFCMEVSAFLKEMGKKYLNISTLCVFL